MTLAISAGSLEYVRVRVFAKEAGVVVNPTADTVQMAFKSDGTFPSGGDWKSAAWETDGSTEPDTYYARALVGPGGVITLAAATYATWLKITDAPEAPVRKVGILLVY